MSHVNAKAILDNEFPDASSPQHRLMGISLGKIRDMVLDRRLLEVEYCKKVHAGLLPSPDMLSSSLEFVVIIARA
ncbi:hypothetical protein Tco_1477238 [Tanacetum coccineum]